MAVALGAGRRGPLMPYMVTRRSLSTGRGASRHVPCRGSCTKSDEHAGRAVSTAVFSALSALFTGRGLAPRRVVAGPCPELARYRPNGMIDRSMPCGLLSRMACADRRERARRRCSRGGGGGASTSLPSSPLILTWRLTSNMFPGVTASQVLFTARMVMEGSQNRPTPSPSRFTAS